MKRVRKKTFYALAAAWVIQTSAYADQTLENLSTLLKERPISITNELVVNTENKVRYAAMISEKQGIKDLFQKVYTSEFEEGYTYVKSFGAYVEIGKNEENGKIYAGVEFENNVIKKLYCTYGNLINTHIHPTRDVKKPEKITSAIPRKQWDYLEMLPSFEDLTSYLILCKELYKIKDGNIVDRIQSKFGITEYSLTKKGKKYIEFLSNAEVAGYVAEKTNVLNNIFSNKIQPLERIVHTASRILNDEYLKWEFIPYTELFN